MPAPSHPVRYRIEYVLLVGCKAFFCVLPHAVAQGIAVGLGLVAYRLMASRRREALRRLRLVLGPEVPEKTLRRVGEDLLCSVCSPLTQGDNRPCF